MEQECLTHQGGGYLWRDRSNTVTNRQPVKLSVVFEWLDDVVNVTNEIYSDGGQHRKDESIMSHVYPRTLSLEQEDFQNPCCP